MTTPYETTTPQPQEPITSHDPAATSSRGGLRSELRGVGYAEGQQRVSTVDTSVADAFLANPAGYCAGVYDAADMAFVKEQARALTALVSGSGWTTLREIENPDMSALEPIEAHFWAFLNASPPSVAQRINVYERNQVSELPVADGERVNPDIAGAQYMADHAQRVMNTPRMLAAFRTALGAETVGALADMASWDVTSAESRGLGGMLMRLGIPPEALAVHEYTLTPLGGANVSVGTPGPVGLTSGLGVMRYRVEYRGPRGPWTVETGCVEASGGAGAGVGVDIPLSPNIVAPGGPVTQTEAVYFGRESFTGVEPVSMGQAGGQAGGTGATEGFVSFVNGVTFVFPMPEQAEFSSAGADTFSAGIGGTGTAAMCHGSEVGERQGPEPIRPIADDGQGVWLPFFHTVVGFETASSTLGDGDYEAIAGTLQALVSDRMQPLFDAGAVEFRLTVTGNASGRYRGAADEQDALLRNLDLSRGRADAVRGELERLIDTNPAIFGEGGIAVPAQGRGAEWAQGELGEQAQSNNDDRYRSAEIVVWVQVCGSPTQTRR